MDRQTDRQKDRWTDREIKSLLERHIDSRKLRDMDHMLPFQILCKLASCSTQTLSVEMLVSELCFSMFNNPALWNFEQWTFTINIYSTLFGVSFSIDSLPITHYLRQRDHTMNNINFHLVVASSFYSIRFITVILFEVSLLTLRWKCSSTSRLGRKL